MVICNGRILEKPLNEEEARAFLRMYGNHPCSTVGCTTVTDTVTGKRVSAVDIATIYFRHIDEPTIDKLIASGEIYHCAGGLMIENPLVLPFLERVDGSEESVMGISSPLLSTLFEKLDVP